jgi:hypothetical protein
MPQKYAIAVRDPGGALRLLTRVHRGPKGDVYVIFNSRLYPGAHATFHASGQTHVKIRRDGTTVFRPTIKQKPDQSFVGTETVFQQGINTHSIDCYTDPCDPTKFDDVFIIPRESIPDDTAIEIVVDLTASDSDPSSVYDAEKILSKTIGSQVPWIVFGLHRHNVTIESRRYRLGT